MMCYSLYFQVDIFVIDSVFLGKLSSIRIGHSETKLGTFFSFPRAYELKKTDFSHAQHCIYLFIKFIFVGYGWFLDKVFVKEGPEATRAFEFNCNR